LDGASPQERKKWHLKDKTQYHYVDQSSVLEIPSISDKEEFALLTSSMHSVGIARSEYCINPRSNTFSTEQDMVFRLLSGILTLGNTTFIEKEVFSFSSFV
jgi:myosin heavy subunit